MDGAQLNAAQGPVCGCRPTIVCHASASVALYPACGTELFLMDYPKILRLLSPLAFPSFPLSRPPLCLAGGSSRTPLSHSPAGEGWLCPGTLQQEPIHSAAPGRLMQVQPTCFTLPAFDFSICFLFWFG